MKLGRRGGGAWGREVGPGRGCVAPCWKALPEHERTDSSGLHAPNVKSPS